MCFSFSNPAFMAFLTRKIATVQLLTGRPAHKPDTHLYQVLGKCPAAALGIAQQGDSSNHQEDA
jgi:hypothetical protein